MDAYSVTSSESIGISKTEHHQMLLHLIEEVRNGLLDKGVEVDDDLIILVIKLESLDPLNRFLIKQPFVESELERMKKIAMEKILQMPPVSRNLLLMQSFYRSNHLEREDAEADYKAEVQDKIGPYFDELKNDVPSDVDHYDYYYSHLVLATIIQIGLGDEEDPAVIIATKNCLNRVFPKEDISLLLSMSKRQRAHELRHVMNIAIGMRVFQSAEKLGDNDLTELIPDMIADCTTLVMKKVDENVKRMIKYTTLLRPYFLSKDTKAGIVSIEMVTLRQALVMVHQLVIFFKELKVNLTQEELASGRLISAFRHNVTNLKDTAHDTANNFTSYPRYVELAKNWKKLQRSYAYVSSLNMLVDTIVKFSDATLKEVDEKIVHPKSHGLKFPSPKEFFSFPTVKLPDDTFALAETMEFKEDMDPLDMAFSGFSIHSLVEGKGLVLLGNPNLGVFNWKGQSYLLSTPKSAMEFRREPETYIKRAIGVVRQWPELISLMNVEREALDINIIIEEERRTATTAVSTASSDKPIVSRDMDTQTLLHPLSSRIVKHYTWNEWELRRRGLTLSKIHKCSTHGTQTHWQALKKNTEVQTYSQKEREVQTMHNVYTELPMSQFYFYGLRGLHCDVPPHIVELTTDNPDDLTCLCKTSKKEEQQEIDNSEVRLPSSTSGQRRCRRNTAYGKEEIENWVTHKVPTSITRTIDRAKSFPYMAPKMSLEE